MAWSETNGTIVAANIIPSSPQDKYPTHHANFGRGGYKTVANEEERLAIPIDRLTVGSVVRQHDTGIEWVVKTLPDSINSNYHTGKDCTWEAIKSGGLDEEALAALKGQPGGLAELDSEGKVPTSQSRSIIFRGTYVDETTFNSNNGVAHVKMTNAIYIDNATGRMYSWSEDQQKFLRDTIYWQDI